MDQSFDAIELDRLKELTLLQTFDVRHVNKIYSIFLISFYNIRLSKLK